MSLWKAAPDSASLQTYQTLRSWRSVDDTRNNAQIREALPVSASIDKHFVIYRTELNLYSKLHELGITRFECASISELDSPPQTGFLIVTQFEYQEIGGPYVALQPAGGCLEIKPLAIEHNVEEFLRSYSPVDPSFTIINSWNGLRPREKLGTWTEKYYATMEDWLKNLKKEYPDGIW
ncbi:hypothetical protein OBBRIDRAFT_804781 [Obba rivulosa]|uniref:Uncharacterized protein n=1 Tax=Obba rivulosa TaxID=1052685 RepID=A0A8E2B194_9APHY|nr:hypothetical protein OBBRIDRAFT_804781 [Obba rivulosa]